MEFAAKYQAHGRLPFVPPLCKMRLLRSQQAGSSWGMRGGGEVKLGEDGSWHDAGGEKSLYEDGQASKQRPWKAAKPPSSEVFKTQVDKTLSSGVRAWCQHCSGLGAEISHGPCSQKVSGMLWCYTSESIGSAGYCSGWNNLALASNRGASRYVLMAGFVKFEKILIQKLFKRIWNILFPCLRWQLLNAEEPCGPGKTKFIKNICSFQDVSQSGILKENVFLLLHVLKVWKLALYEQARASKL